MTTLRDWTTAVKARDVFRSIARQVIREERPEPRTAQVVSINRPARTCVVIYNGETEPVTVPMGPIEPIEAGQWVRIDGMPGDRHITEVFGRATLAGALPDPTIVEVSLNNGQALVYDTIAQGTLSALSYTTIALFEFDGQAGFNAAINDFRLQFECPANTVVTIGAAETGGSVLFHNPDTARWRQVGATGRVAVPANTAPEWFFRYLVGASNLYLQGVIKITRTLT